MVLICFGVGVCLTAGVVRSRRCVADPPIDFIFDHPFAFLIFDDSITFVGTVNQPTIIADEDVEFHDVYHDEF